MPESKILQWCHLEVNTQTRHSLLSKIFTSKCKCNRHCYLLIIHFLYFAVRSSSKRKCGKVHITVSSLKEAYLELNWITDCDHPLDVEPTHIALYTADPLTKVRPASNDHPNVFD